MTHPHSDTHTHDCSCDHDHAHDKKSLPLIYRWLLSILLVGGLLVLLRPFIIGQMLVRVTTYSSTSAYDDAIRICKKIIAIDKDNKQAWTSLGYAYMDQLQMDMAIFAFRKVLSLNPEDKQAASYELGHIYFKQEQWEMAVEYFQRVRSAGPRAGALLDADVLKYRHGTVAFQNLNNMRHLLEELLICYEKIGDQTNEEMIKNEYKIYNKKHSRNLF